MGRGMGRRAVDEGPIAVAVTRGPLLTSKAGVDSEGLSTRVAVVTDAIPVGGVEDEGSTAWAAMDDEGDVALGTGIFRTEAGTSGRGASSAARASSWRRVLLAALARTASWLST